MRKFAAIIPTLWVIAVAGSWAHSKFGDLSAQEAWANVTIWMDSAWISYSAWWRSQWETQWENFGWERAMLYVAIMGIAMGLIRLHDKIDRVSRQLELIMRAVRPDLYRDYDP